MSYIRRFLFSFFFWREIWKLILNILGQTGLEFVMLLSLLSKLCDCSTPPHLVGCHILMKQFQGHITGKVTCFFNYSSHFDHHFSAYFQFLFG